MVIPSQDPIKCKSCAGMGTAHHAHKLHCEPCGRRRSAEHQKAYRERQKAVPRDVQCAKCDERFSTTGPGRAWRCKPCLKEYMAEYAEGRRVQLAGYSKAYRARQGDAYRAKMAARRSDAIASMTPEQAAEFRRKECEKSKRLFGALREQVYDAYGRSCACCGEATQEFLSIDHVKNDGAEMRKNGTHGSGGTAFYQWLRKNGFPGGFQTLCMNCNVGKHRNGGVCPHKSGKV
jgi:hypothetical protein